MHVNKEKCLGKCGQILGLQTSQTQHVDDTKLSFLLTTGRKLITSSELWYCLAGGKQDFIGNWKFGSV